MLAPTIILVELIATLTVLLMLPYLLYFQYIKGKSRDPVAQIVGSSSEKISILICTLNSADTIQKKIPEILDQNYPPEKIELVVVDGGSTDGTVDILRRIAKEVGSRVSFKLVSDRPFVSKASQINEGFRTSSASFVITTDADCVVEAGAIPILMGTLNREGIGAVCSRQVLMNPNQNLVTKTEVAYRNFYQTLRMGESNLHSTPIYHGGLSGYRKEAYMPIFEDVNADDTQLAFGAIRKGFRALYEPRCLYRTKSPSGSRDGFSQRVRRGQGLQRVFWRNRDMIFSSRFGEFGFPIFVAEFFMHVVSPLLFLSTGLLLIGFSASLITASPVLGLPLCLLALLTYLKRKSGLVVFVASFAYYQLALCCAMILHSVGYNYSRWSRKSG